LPQKRQQKWNSGVMVIFMAFWGNAGIFLCIPRHSKCSICCMRNMETLSHQLLWRVKIEMGLQYQAE
jgi:hypothetical protein